MPDPEGKLVTPVAFDTNDDPRSLVVDEHDHLLVAAPDLDDHLVGVHGYIGGSWQKQPMALGVSEIVCVQIGPIECTGAYQLLSTVAVSAGEYWTVLGVNAWDADNAITRVNINFRVDGRYILEQLGAALAANVRHVWSGRKEIGPGDLVACDFYDGTVDDDLFILVHYIRVDIDL